MTVYQQADDWIGKQAASLCERVIHWSNINSGSYHHAGIAKQRQLLQQAFAPLATDSQLIESTPYQVINELGELVTVHSAPTLSFRHNPEAKHSILLAGHMDTVFPVDSHFQQVTELSPAILNGPGLADMKGGLVVMLTALQALMRSEHANDIGWQVLINADEEIGSQGSSACLAAAAAQHDLAFVYEPSVDDSGTLAGSRKGSGKFTAVAKGLAAHAGRAFHEGKHAIAALSDWVLAVHHLNGQRPDVTINVGFIQGGGAVNVVPDLALARLDIRTTCAEDESWFEQAMADISSEVEARHGVAIKVHGQFGRKPKALTGKTLALFEWVRAVGAELSLDLRWQATGGCCDGNNLAAAGLPTVDTLGVRGGRIHSDQEYLCVDSLVERARLSAHLLLTAARDGWR